MGATTLSLGFAKVKQFDFSWEAVPGVESYQLFERLASDGEYAQIGGDIVETSVSLTMPLHLRFGASYRVRACDAGGACTDSEPVEVLDSMADAVGKFTSGTAGTTQWFGCDVALSADGDTLAVGALLEDKVGAVHVFTRMNAVWSMQERLDPSYLDPDMSNNFGVSVALAADGSRLAIGANGEDKYAGAVYVFERVSGKWSSRGRFLASNTAPGTAFGRSVALSGDGTVLAVGSDGEASGVADDEDDTSVAGAGAAYVFVWSGADWAQNGYLKATDTNIKEKDRFGTSVALSFDGAILAVGAPAYDSGARPGAVYVFGRSVDVWSHKAALAAAAPGVGDRFGFSVAMSTTGDTIAVGSPGGDAAGGVHVFERSGANTWERTAVRKASNAVAGDSFGTDVALSADGTLLAVGANQERSAATGVGGDQDDATAPGAGAAYVFVGAGGEWSQTAYVKAPSPAAGSQFGYAVALSKLGDTLGVGAWLEDREAKQAGAVYLY